MNTLDKDTALMLAHARLTTRTAVLTCHPARLALALGRDRRRVATALAWATNGDPESVYVSSDDGRVHRLFEALFPNLVDAWRELAARRPKDPDDCHQDEDREA